MLEKLLKLFYGIEKEPPDNSRWWVAIPGYDNPLMCFKRDINKWPNGWVTCIDVSGNQYEFSPAVPLVLEKSNVKK